MKQGLVVFMLIACAANCWAQPENTELTEHQIWVLNKTEQFYKNSGVNIARKVVINNFRELLSSNQLCESSFDPALNIHLKGERINEESTFISWEVTAEKGNARYIIERRLNNQYGAFDSIGVVDIPRIPAAFQSYRFVDENDFPVTTWYRLRRIGKLKEESKLISVAGYRSSLKVMPNPARSSDISIQLSKFKLDNHTTLMITDSRGLPVHRTDKAFISSNVYQPFDLRLAKGVYFIKVINKLNTATATFVVQ